MQILIWYVSPCLIFLENKLNIFLYFLNSIFNLKGDNIGNIKSVLNHGASDLLEVEISNEKNSILIPFTQKIVPKVDIKNSIVIVDPPKGLV